jgi:protein gp37
MGANTKIEWADHTFNPWRGCAHAVLADGSEHPACAHCYAEAMSKRNPAVLGQWGADGTRVRAADDYWKLPFKWNRDASFKNDLGAEIEQNTGSRPGCYSHRPRVFCASLADVFEDWQGPIVDGAGLIIREKPGMKGRMITMEDLRRELFTLIDATPHLDWLLLTKRPENVRRMWPDMSAANHLGIGKSWRRHNVFLGTSISDQQTCDEYYEKLLALLDLAPILFLSIEPLLGPVDLGLRNWANLDRYCGRLWVIVGGESGHHARPTHPDWVRFIRDDCQAAGVPFFFKQWGEWAPADKHPLKEVGDRQAVQCVRSSGGDRILRGDGRFSGDSPQEGDAWMARVGKKAAGRLLDGREWNELPEVQHA